MPVGPTTIVGHTYPYRNRPLVEALDELAGLGLSRVEVWLGHAGEGPDMVAEALQERGLEAAAVGAGGFYTVDSDVPRTIELAQALEAPIIVACVSPEVLDSVLERVPADITLCVENHWDQALATARNVSRALAAHPRMAACVDTGHAILAGETPERFVDTLGARVGHVHLKDASAPPLRERLLGRRLRRRLLPRPDPVMPGAGVLDVRGVRRALEAIGYAGSVTVEHEGTEPTVALGRLLDAWASSTETLVPGS